VTSDGVSLRAVFGCFPTGVTAVGAVVDDQPVGMAVSSFTSVSLDPPLVSACVAKTSTTWQTLRSARWLGVSILAANHGTICRQLAAADPAGRFTDVSWDVTDGGAVRIRSASAWFECELEREISVGDHFIAILRIVSHLADPTVEPLVFHRSSFRRLLAS
jgi:flavin reductase (DIM6/NTAB) family NADH-FMN oxidoreductase RutF